MSFLCHFGKGSGIQIHISNWRVGDLNILNQSLTDTLILVNTPEVCLWHQDKLGWHSTYSYHWTQSLEWVATSKQPAGNVSRLCKFPNSARSSPEEGGPKPCQGRCGVVAVWAIAPAVRNMSLPSVTNIDIFLSGRWDQIKKKPWCGCCHSPLCCKTWLYTLLNAVIGYWITLGNLPPWQLWS